MSPSCRNVGRCGRSGLRFYNSDTGRWLNRDPIGESGGAALCAFVSNDSVNSYDVYGLYAPNAYRALRKFRVDMYSYTTVRTTTLFSLLDELRRAADAADESLTSVALTSRLEYDDQKNTILLDPLFVPNLHRWAVAPTLAHELAHAYYDIIAGANVRDDKADEAEAHIVGAFVEMNTRLANMERELGKRKSCEEKSSYLRFAWPRFWKNWGTLPNPAGWGDYSWNEKYYFWVWTPFPHLDSDFRNLTAPLENAQWFAAKTRYPLGFKCSKIANAINNLIWSSGCCESVSCSESDQGFLDVIDAAHPIMVQFR